MKLLPVICGLCLTTSLQAHTLSKDECRISAQDIYISTLKRDKGVKLKTLMKQITPKIQKLYQDQDSYLRDEEDLKRFFNTLNFVYINKHISGDDLAEGYYNHCMSKTGVEI